MTTDIRMETMLVPPADTGLRAALGWRTMCTTEKGLVLMMRPQRRTGASGGRDTKIAGLQAELAAMRNKLAAAELRIELLEAKVVPPRLERVVGIVADAWGIDRQTLFNRSTGRRVASVRQACFALAFTYARCSLEDIGRAFDRDHSTVRYGIDRARALVDHDREYAARFRAAEVCLGGAS